MKHIKNFKDYSVNELMDWVSMPVDVNRGLGDLMNQFYSDFPSLVDKLKKYFGKKFNQFMDSINNLVDKITMKIGMKDIKEMGKHIISYFGGRPTKKQLESEVTKLVEQESDNSVDKVKSTQNVFSKILGSAAMLITPIVAPVKHVVVNSDTLRQFSDLPQPSGFAVVIGIILVILCAILHFSGNKD